MKEVVIVCAKRTAIGKFLGSLSTISATNLGSTVISSVISQLTERGRNLIDEVIFGQVIQSGQGQNTARQAAIKAGLDQSIPAMTINKVCGSGMKTVHLAYQSIVAGDADIIVVGGQENMSLAPHILPNSRNGQRLGHWNLHDSLLLDGLTCALSNGIHMGITAEHLAKKYNISRTQQDEFSINSQIKAHKAQKNGSFEEEIVEVHIPPTNHKGNDTIFKQDEFIRDDVNIKNLSNLKSVFKKEGTVTVANSSGLNDGAAALLVMSLDKAQQLDLKPLVKIVGCASAGVDPSIMGIGPVIASQKCLQKIGWSINDLDVIELNEAFAAQAIAVNKELKWDVDKVNLNGGSIALGHPIGASGARILVTLIHLMQQKKLTKGLATMCIGGGQGITTALELMN